MKKYWGFIILLTLFACKNGEADWNATGTFDATEVMVSAQGSGTIMALEVEEGSSCIAGEQLGYIDTTQLYLKSLQLQSSISGIDNRKSNIPLQIAALEQQIEWLKGEKIRFEKLYKANAANRKQVDDIQNQLQIAEKQLSAQKQALESGNKSLSNESSAIDIQIAQIEDQLKKCYISSPITGTVLAKYAEAGEFVSTGRALFSVANLEGMYLRAYITGDLLSLIKLGQTVKVYADMGEKEQKEYTGTITWIADKAEFTPKNIQTRDERSNLVYAIKVAVPNDGYLKIGMYGQVKF